MADLRFTLCALDVAVELGGDDVLVLDEVRALLDHLRLRSEEVPPRQRLSITVDRDRQGRHRFLIDGRDHLILNHEGAALHELMFQITRRAVESCATELVLHAGAVVFDGRLIVISGPSGSGKSTLTGALVAAGATYVTDEVLVVGGGGRAERGLARPLQLDRRAHELLGWPEDTARLSTAEGARYRPIAVGQLHQGALPEDVVLALLGGREGPCRLEEVARSHVAAGLLHDAFEPGRRTRQGLERVSDLVTTAISRRVVGGSPYERVEKLVMSLKEM